MPWEICTEILWVSVKKGKSFLLPAWFSKVVSTPKHYHHQWEEEKSCPRSKTASHTWCSNLTLQIWCSTQCVKKKKTIVSMPWDSCL
ncbi:hypothetical protein LEMLEM_LOCUS17939 [Lemmus lemmus]